VITRRRMLAATGGLAAAASAGRAAAQEGKGTMQISRSGSQPSSKGPAEYFTGSVRIDSRFQGSAPARVGGGIVTFEPGARTAWHTHPLGQTLIVTFGCGWVQRQGGAKEEIRPGDVVWIPAGEKHWHGATATTAMAHTRSQRPWTERASTGWSRSATNSIRPDKEPWDNVGILSHTVLPISCHDV
jgi:quercetin dioxygenase-like cupin family protein